MPVETLPDLSLINLAEAIFLECNIQSGDGQDTNVVHRVSGFTPAQVRIHFKFGIKEKQFGFVFHINCQAVDEAGNPAGVTGQFKIHLRFEIENLHQLLTKVGDSDFPNGPLTHALLGAAYSTVRGMVLSKVSDTALQGLSLPLRSVQSLFEETLAHESDEKPPVTVRRKRKKPVE